MTGAYQNVLRDGKMVAVEVEYMTNDERILTFGGYNPQNLIAWLNVVCTTLNAAERRLEVLSEEVQL